VGTVPKKLLTNTWGHSNSGVPGSANLVNGCDATEKEAATAPEISCCIVLLAQSFTIILCRGLIQYTGITLDLIVGLFVCNKNCCGSCNDVLIHSSIVRTGMNSARTRTTAARTQLNRVRTANTSTLSLRRQHSG